MATSENGASSSPSRRHFMKTSSALVAGGSALAAANLSIAKTAHAYGSDEIRIGLVGCGGRGTGAVQQALNTHNQGPVKLVAMADAFMDRLDTCYQTVAAEHSERMDVPPEHRFDGFDGYKKVLEVGVDVIILATPPGFRPIHFEEAVKQGVHVFMEKPVAVDAPGVRKVLAAAKEAKEKGLAVGVGLQRHHQKVYMEAIERIHDGAIGDIQLTRVYWNGGGVWVRPRRPNYTEMEYQMRNWYYFNWLCGDHICEQHIHNLDVSNWIKQAHPVKANGMGGREVRTGNEYGQIFDHFAVEYTYEDGSTMMSQCRHIKHCWSPVTEFAVGTKGTSHPQSGLIKSADGEWKFDGKSPNPYQVEHDDLFRAIRKGEPYSEAEYGAHSTMTSILGRMATYSGKVVTWDEALEKGKDLSPAEYAWNATPPVTPSSDGSYPVPVPGVYDPFV